VANFKYFPTTLTSQNSFHEEIKSRINSGNCCYRSVQSLLSSRPLSINIKNKIHKTSVLPVVLYRYETLSLALREEHKLRVSENRVLRRKFGSKTVEVAGGRRRLLNEELHNLYTSRNVMRLTKSKRVRMSEHLACMGQMKNAF
jgi:hypothetical protein